MPTLVIDAAAGRCAVGLFDGGALLAERCESMGKGHAEALFPMIRDTLRAAGTEARALDLICAVTGPGNMTGARIGCAAARGLAVSTAALGVGVSRFEAVAETVAPDLRPLCVALAGRGGAVHLCRYETGAEAMTPQTLRLEDGADFAVGADLAGDGAAALIAALGLTVSPLSTEEPPLAAFARVAERRARGAPPRPAPLYLRPVAAAPPRAAPPPILA